MSKPIPCSAKISGFADPRNKKADIRIFNKDMELSKFIFDER
jgi:hypothetical protein